MKTLNNDEATAWINTTGLYANMQSEEQEGPCGQKWTAVSREVAYQPANNHGLRIPLPEISWHRLTNLASRLLPHKGQSFQPCLIWFTDWGMWNENHERVAYRLLNLLRTDHGELCPLIETPAHLFAASEVVDAQTVLTIAMFIGWDVYLVPEDGDFLVHNSHHECVDIFSRNAAIHADKLTVFRDWRAREAEPGR